jgi:hypothetical protein
MARWGQRWRSTATRAELGFPAPSIEARGLLQWVREGKMSHAEVCELVKIGEVARAYLE